MNLNKYLEGLVKEAETKIAARSRFADIPIRDLLSIAGVKMASTKCGGCGSDLEKGSNYKCACGMKMAADLIEGGKADEKKDSDFSSAQLAAGQKVEMEHTTDPAKAREISRDHLEEFPDYYTRLKAMENEAEKAKGNQGPQEAEGEQKDFVSGAQELMAESGGEKTSAKRDMPHFTDQDRPEKVKEIYRALKRDHPDMPAEKKARIAARQGKKGKQHQGPPYKGPLSKESSINIAAAAGRIMTKIALDAPTLNKEEIEEALQGAQSREDVAGRARNWAIGGGIGGGLLGGGLGTGIGALLKPRLGPLAPIIGGLAGGGLGATAGGLIGREEGAEEALADRLISQIRQSQAAQQGMQRGTMLGYMAGRGGGDFGGEPEGEEIAKGASPFRRGR